VRPPSPEFPEGADLPPELSRRSLLELLGASAALAGAAGCSRGRPELIVPYVDQPPEVTPSVPAAYATTMALDGYGIGLVVTSHEGRPTKAEGNPRHPASGGALGAVEQASILSLYDPTRARGVRRAGLPATWSALAAAIAAPGPAGKRTHVLLEPTSAPHVIDLVQRLRRRDVAVWFDAPLARDAARDGARLAFGRVVEPRYDFARAEVVLSLDADFLGVASSPKTWARAWSTRRRTSAPGEAMSRLYAVEARLSVTGMSADERLRVQSRQVQGVGADVLAQLLGSTRAPGPWAAWARAAARDLRDHAGASVVLAGDGQPREVHALAHAMNAALGNAGKTVTYGPSPIVEAGEPSHGLAGLLRAIDAGEASALIIVGGDPAYTAPADLELARLLHRVPLVAYVGAHAGETARHAAWFAPEAHWLEAWGDARAFDGTASIAQPLIRPMHDGKTAAQVLAAMLGAPDADSRALVMEHWRAAGPRDDFDGFWQTALVHGVVDGSAQGAVDVRLDQGAVAKLLATPTAPSAPLEIVYFEDPKVYDGRFGDNAWLQELPDPVTKLTWDNAALVSPSTASRDGLRTGDAVTLEVRGRRVDAPVLVVPGMADGVVAIALGYGQQAPGRLSAGVGANAYALRDSRAPWADAAAWTAAGRRWELAITQGHWSMEGRAIALSRTLGELRADPDFAKPYDERPRFLYELAPRGRRQWGMTIDLSTCTGCSACVVACMAENNVPVVGKREVALSREMHWLRIDRYFEGDAGDPVVSLQPMLCQHCEKAPCEYVCPVNATVHSDDGLNEMVYNRCVGTRFCSNNCPYKVRRFNYFNYHAGQPTSLELGANPDVTVRARGVMEKCTYCVQRIRAAEIRAHREGRPIADLEIQTACQQTCPTGAIVFGDVANEGTRVSESRRSPRVYAVLNELGTLPRTRYLARIRNPNPSARTP
jgi:molybdopterin-containing oxidoreductase family iron-sulfur binding subunit